MNLKTEDFFKSQCRGNIYTKWVQCTMFQTRDVKVIDVICYLENFEINIINKQIK